MRQPGQVAGVASADPEFGELPSRFDRFGLGLPVAGRTLRLVAQDGRDSAMRDKFTVRDDDCVSAVAKDGFDRLVDDVVDHIWRLAVLGRFEMVTEDARRHRITVFDHERFDSTFVGQWPDLVDTPGSTARRSCMCKRFDRAIAVGPEPVGDQRLRGSADR